MCVTCSVSNDGHHLRRAARRRNSDSGPCEVVSCFCILDSSIRVTDSGFQNIDSDL